MKPWHSDELIWSSSSGAVNSGGLQKTVSRIVCPIPSGNAPGDQWLSAATRENDILLSGLRFEPTLPPANAISSISVFNWLAAIRAIRSARRPAASLAVPATAGAKRVGRIAPESDHAASAPAPLWF